MEGKKTPQKVRALLATLKPNPLRGKYRITADTIDAYCSKAGRQPQTAENLGIILRAMQMAAQRQPHERKTQ